MPNNSNGNNGQNNNGQNNGDGGEKHKFRGGNTGAQLID